MFLFMWVKISLSVAVLKLCDCYVVVGVVYIGGAS